MAGEFEKEPESTRARLAQQDGLSEYKRAQHERITNRALTTPLESVSEYEARVAMTQDASENVTYGSGGALQAAMYKDKPLADALCAILSDFAGEHGDSEGAVECLERLVREICTHRRVTRIVAKEAMARQPHAPGKIFSQEAVLTVLKAEKARVTYLKPATSAQVAKQDAKVSVIVDLIRVFSGME